MSLALFSLQNVTSSFRFHEAADGILLLSCASYEPEAIAAIKAWFAERGRPAYACGPYLPPTAKHTANSIEKTQSGNSDEIQTFLDDALNTVGKQSVLYVNARHPLPMRIHPLTTSCDHPDIIWFSLLARQVTAEPLGVPRRRHGIRDPFCE